MTQVNKDCDHHSLGEPIQSAYRRDHCTEKALLLLLKDQGKVILLALLDLSAAFDTVKHSILMRKLKREYGISDVALAWFESYLADRDQKV